MTLAPKVNDTDPEEAMRNVNPEVSTLGALNSIQHSTGGYTRLEWENHVVCNVNPYLLPSYLYPRPQSLSVSVDTLYYYRYSPKKLVIDNYSIQSGKSYSLDLTKYFDMNPQNLMLSEYETEHDTLYAYNYPRVCIYKKNGYQQQLVRTYYLDKKTIEEVNGNKPINLTLSAGTYKFELLDSINIYNAQLGNEFMYANGNTGRIYLTQTSYSSSVHPNAVKWAGLRIKRIISDPVKEDSTIYKNFFYDSPDNSYSTGYVQHIPKFVYQNYYSYSTQNTSGGIAVATLGISQGTGLPRLSVGSPEVGYSCVTVNYSEKDPLKPNSYLSNYEEKYKYTTVNDNWAYKDVIDTEFLTSQPPGQRTYTSKRHWRGLLKEKSTRRYNRITEKYSYDVFEKENPPILTTDLFVVSDFSNAPLAVSTGAKDYSIGKYSIIPYNQRLKGINTYFDHMEIMTDSVKYTYFSDSYAPEIIASLVKTSSKIDSYGKTVTTHFTYLTHNGTYLDVPQTETVVCDGIIIGGKRYEYYPGTTKLKATYSISSKGLYWTEAFESISPTPQLLSIFTNKEYEYQYNDAGRICQISYRSLPLVSYLWGYNNDYPIVEAKSVTYQQLCNAAGTYLSSLASGNEAVYNSLFQELKRNLQGKELLTFTYHWLVGILKATDASGRSTTYNYDNQNRLVSIKDFNDFIIKKYEYNTVL